MRKLKALLLTEGMHGMISQVEGMAKALNTEYSHKIVRLSFPWNLKPPKFTPILQIVLKDKIYLTLNLQLNLRTLRKLLQVLSIGHLLVYWLLSSQ